MPTPAPLSQRGAGHRLWTFVSGGETSEGLPARVRSAIQERQRSSEILIGWLQMALVLFFAGFYAVSPKTGAGAMLQPVPVALGAYFLFTSLRLVLAYRLDLPRWFLFLSVVADIALLMGLIWSFHIQYHQPPSFYLKAPTLLYVFIFIGLRALRFDAGYVLMAGATAAAGWSVLMAYVIISNPADTMITRDYVAYMTSNAILIGAEVDKIVSILVVTLVVALAMTRARRALVTAVHESAAAADLSRFVAPEVADRIRRSDKAVAAGDQEDRLATIMFTDIQGFSTLSEGMNPAELADLLNAYFESLAGVIADCKGTINQFQGDALIVTFNTAIADDDHAANALRCARGIQEVVNNRVYGKGFHLKTRCGINTGPIIAGTVGTKDRLIYTVYGDAVNIAARLEPLNKQYGSYILLSAETAAAAGEGFAFRPVGETVVRGRQEPTRLFVLDS